MVREGKGGGRMGIEVGRKGLPFFRRDGARRAVVAGREGGWEAV